MSQIIVFILLATLMTSLALYLTLYAFFKSRHSNANDQNENIIAAKERLQNLQNQAALTTPEVLTEHKQEIESLLLEEVKNDYATPNHYSNTNDKSGIILAVALILLAPILYVLLGTPESLSAPKTLTELTDTLNQRLSKNPDDLDTLVKLARIYRADNQAKAIEYYQRASLLDEATTDLLVEQVDMLIQYMPNHPDIALLIQTGLDKEPNHGMLLWLAGLHAFLLNQYETALSYWHRSYPLFADQPEQQWVAKAITKAKKQIAEQKTTTPEVNAK